jgi:hypothetical protein
LIAALEKANPGLAGAFDAARHAAESESKFARRSGRSPLTGVGDVNTYALFAELGSSLTSVTGRAGIVVPTGIATDDTSKAFFASLTVNRHLARLVAFENREGLFPAVDSRYQFCALVAASQPVPRASFSFFLTRAEQTADDLRRFHLSSDDLALLNPNTRTCPVFRTKADAELTLSIYHSLPVLVAEEPQYSPWNPRLLRVFDMNRPDVIQEARTRSQLRAEGFDLDEFRRFRKGSKEYLPVFESKMVAQYDYRAATYEGVSAEAAGRGQPRESTNDELRDHHYHPAPRYWLPSSIYPTSMEFVKARQWIVGYRNIARSTDYRTMIACPMPLNATDFSLRVLVTEGPKHFLALLLANWNSLVFDYVLRQKLGGTNLSSFIIRQLPVLPPAAYSERDKPFALKRIVALSYVSRAMSAFATDCGCRGGPLGWDTETRLKLRCELDAYYARLYGLTRKQLRYILDPHGLSDAELEDILDPWEDPTCSGPHLLPAEPTTDFPGETFRVLKENETRKYGEYRTRRLVLDAWARLEEELGPVKVVNYREQIAEG